MATDWYGIKKQISSTMMDFGFRVYVSIADVFGNPKIMDEEIEPFKDIVCKSIKINSTYLNIGDYAIPISSKNLMIFKISEKAVVVLFANKGNIAQLLSFKKNIDYFGEQIEKLLEDMEVPEEEVIITPEIKKVEKPLPKQILGKELPIYYPSLNRELDKKAKFTMEEMRILHMCDGKKSFFDIAHETKQPESFLFDFITKNIKKKWLGPNAYPITIQCPDCNLTHYLLIHSYLFEEHPDLLSVLIRSERCNHEYVVFLNKKLKFELQSFGYFTPFQQDKFMKKLGQHFYTIIS
ncbi:MAG: hypothetical protein ACFFDN_11465 [Candidatus Hodarchaeota archaeon]